MSLSRRFLRPTFTEGIAGRWGWSIASRNTSGQATLEKRNLVFGIVLVVFIFLFITVDVALRVLAVIAVCRGIVNTAAVLRVLESAIFRRQLAMLLALVLCLHSFQLGSALLFLLTLLSVGNLVLPHECYRRASKDRLVLTEVANPDILGLGRMTSVVVKSPALPGPRSGSVLLCGTFTSSWAGGWLVMQIGVVIRNLVIHPCLGTLRVSGSTVTVLLCL